MDFVIRELRHAARSLAKQPALTLATVITLALGIGAATAVFSVLDAVVLRALPYPHAERLAILWVDFGEAGQSLPAVSGADFRDLCDQVQSYEAFGAVSSWTTNLTGEGDPEQVDMGQVTHDFFSVLGVAPAKGRGFLPEEDVPSGADVAVLSHALWQRRFGGDPGVVGRKIQLDGVDHRVIGVMPAGFELLTPAEGVFLGDADVWVPLKEFSWDGPRNRTLLTAFGRLRQDATFDEAQQEMDSLVARLRETHQVHQLSDTRMRVVPLHHDVVKTVRPALLALFASAVLVLLIACGNVASLLTARATSRRHEIAIRTALGAGRARIAFGLLLESGLLALAGGAVGVLLAWWGATVLRARGPADLPRLASVAVDWPVLAFAGTAAAITVLLFGVVPALRTARLGAWSGAGGARGATAGKLPARQAVVVGQVALSLVLLLGVGLLARSLVLLQDVDPGFDSRGVMTFRLSLPASRYEPAQRVLFFERLEDALRSLPGVRSTGSISYLPLGGGQSSMPYAYDDETALHWERVTAAPRTVTPELFDTLGIRLQAGRLFDRRDTADSQRVVIVDQVLADKAWPGEDPIGKQLQTPVFGPGGVTREWHEVVGLVEHVLLHDLSRDVREQIYFPQAQTSRRSMDVLVAGAVDPENLDPAALAARIPAEVHALDPDLPVHALRALDEYVFAALAQRRFLLTLASIFACVALVLAMVGLYGAVSHAVASRTREFGIRLTLGAAEGGILRLVLAQGVRLVAAGVAAGLAVALAAGGTLSSLLYGVSSTDPLTLVAAPVLLTAVALTACYLPARRATRVDPVVTLRHDG